VFGAVRGVGKSGGTIEVGVVRFDHSGFSILFSSVAWGRDTCDLLPHLFALNLSERLGRLDEVVEPRLPRQYWSLCSFNLSVVAQKDLWGPYQKCGV